MDSVSFLIQLLKVEKGKNNVWGIQFVLRFDSFIGLSESQLQEFTTINTYNLAKCYHVSYTTTYFTVTVTAWYKQQFSYNNIWPVI